MRLSALPRMLKQCALRFQINPYKENGFALRVPYLSPLSGRFQRRTNNRDPRNMLLLLHEPAFVRCQIRAGCSAGNQLTVGTRGETRKRPANPIYWFMKLNTIMQQAGATGYILLWLLGIPIPILLLIFLLRGCT